MTPPRHVDPGRDELVPFGHGLEVFGVFDTRELPDEIARVLDRAGVERSVFRQLILVGHVGRELWAALASSGVRSDDPIDDYSVRIIEEHFAARFPGRRYRILYPGGDALLPLQRLGALAGVHHATPFMVGIDQRWGTWFAYRAVVVADTDLPTTERHDSPSPCASCATRVCVESCPAGALGGELFDLKTCIAYRRRRDSACRETCIARTSCPVGAEHRYDEAQLRYHYGRSLRTIEALRDSDEDRRTTPVGGVTE